MEKNFARILLVYLNSRCFPHPRKWTHDEKGENGGGGGKHTIQMLLPPRLKIQILIERLPQNPQRPRPRQTRRQPIKLIEVMLRKPRLNLIRIGRIPEVQTLAGSNTGVDLAGRAPLFTLET